jgi:hypothetical protein
MQLEGLVEWASKPSTVALGWDISSGGRDLEDWEVNELLSHPLMSNRKIVAFNMHLWEDDWVARVFGEEDCFAIITSLSGNENPRERLLPRMQCSKE